MEKITVKCPACGNKMEIDPKIIAFRCFQCGEKIDLDDGPVQETPTSEPYRRKRSDVKEDSRGWQEFNQYNTAHTERKIDDSAMYEAKLKYENEERKREFMSNAGKSGVELLKTIGEGILAGIVGIGLLIYFFFFN